MGQKRPIHRIPLGRISAAIWLNSNDQGDSWYSVTIVRRYQSNGEWNDSPSYGRDDLPLVRLASDMAFAWIWEHQGATVEETPEE
jgi:hypothetical protein